MSKPQTSVWIATSLGLLLSLLFVYTRKTVESLNNQLERAALLEKKIDSLEASLVHLKNLKAPEPAPETPSQTVLYGVLILSYIFLIGTCSWQTRRVQESLTPSRMGEIEKQRLETLNQQLANYMSQQTAALEKMRLSQESFQENALLMRQDPVDPIPVTENLSLTPVYESRHTPRLRTVASKIFKPSGWDWRRRSVQETPC